LSRPLKVLILAGLALFLLVIGCGGMLLVISGGQPADFIQTAIIRARLAGRTADLNRSVGSDTTPVRFSIDPGDTPRVIANNLYNTGLILDPDLFVDYVRLNDIDVELEAGTYFLNRAQSLTEIANALTDSRSSQFLFRILEGWRIEEIAEVIDSNPYFGFSGADFLNAVGANADIDPTFRAYAGIPAGASLEGFLFPDTYQLPAQVTPTMLRDILLQQFVEQVGTQIPADAAAQGLSLYEIVTLASIIQREAIHADEHPMISSVYRNRLRDGMRLEADPTVQFPIGASGDWWPQITQAEYSSAISPYNTYLNFGLPPGPIANPGISAIRAAVDPEESPYYFFRAACNGSGYHTFAITFEEHLANECR
jgi:UPF0755 protein